MKKKEIILVKLKILINILFSIHEILIVFFRTKIQKKKIILAKLFNTKFGHFYFNTENFLKYKFRKKNLIIFYPEVPFDKNYNDLIEEIKKFGLIVSFGSGFFFFKLIKFLGWEFYDLRKYTFVKHKKDASKTPILFFEKNNINFFSDNKHFATFSIRSSSYNYLTSPYNFGKDPHQKWRDTNQKDLILGLKKFNLQKQYNFFLINNKIKEIGLLNKIKSEKNIKWFNQENYNLKKIFNIVSNAKFHLASATGIDTFAYINNIPTAVVHQYLGGGIHSIYYSKKIIVCPMNLFSIKKKRILTVTEQLDYHQYLQKNYNIDRFELDMQKKYKCFYLKNSSDEIFHLLQEIENYAEGKQIFYKKNDKKLQNLFWKNYPDKWFYPGVKQPVFEKSHGVIISPYFLRKYSKYLF